MSSVRSYLRLDAIRTLLYGNGQKVYPHENDRNIDRLVAKSHYFQGAREALLAMEKKIIDDEELTDDEIGIVEYLTYQLHHLNSHGDIIFSEEIIKENGTGVYVRVPLPGRYEAILYQNLPTIQGV